MNAPSDSDTRYDYDEVLKELTKGYVVLDAILMAEHINEPERLRRLVLVALDHLETAILELDPDNTIAKPPRPAAS